MKININNSIKKYDGTYVFKKQANIRNSDNNKNISSKNEGVIRILFRLLLDDRTAINEFYYCAFYQQLKKKKIKYSDFEHAISQVILKQEETIKKCCEFIVEKILTKKEMSLIHEELLYIKMNSNSHPEYYTRILNGLENLMKEG